MWEREGLVNEGVKSGSQEVNSKEQRDNDVNAPKIINKEKNNLIAMFLVLRASASASVSSLHSFSVLTLFLSAPSSSSSSFIHHALYVVFLLPHSHASTSNQQQQQHHHSPLTRIRTTKDNNNFTFPPQS